MSDVATETSNEGMATRPVKEHEWLKKLLGTWRSEAEFKMGPDGPVQKSTGKETVRSLGGLWALSEGTGSMPDGNEFEMIFALGYDVNVNAYKGCWFASMSSHLWKYDGELSADGKTMTLNCVGPNMEKEGETANYRDIIEFIDDNHRTLTSTGQQPDGSWQEFMKVHYYKE